MAKATAFYARVSSEQQANAGTIKSQISAILERVKADGKLIPPSFQFIDDGYSGTTLARPALERLRDTAHSGALESVYIHSPDRLSRKYAYQILLIEELRKAGVEVVFINRPTKDTPEDELLLQIQGILSEYERAKILERSRRGRIYAAKKGAVSVLSAAPYGYRYLAKKYSTTGQASYQIIPEEAEIVRKVYQWYCTDRTSISAVARRLASEGHRPRNGSEWWNNRTIWGILRNPAYTGRAGFGKSKIGPRRPPTNRPSKANIGLSRHEYSVYRQPPSEWIEIEVPAIISEELFEIAQQQLAENRRRQRSRIEGARYLLQGLIACGDCNRAFTGRPVWYKGSGITYVYYRCPGNDAYRHGGVRTCENGQIRGDLAEDLVWKAVVDSLRNPRSLEKEFLEHNQINELDDQSVHPHQQATFRLLFFQLEDFASRLPESLETMDWQSRRTIVKTLIKQVTIGQSRVSVTFRLGELATPQNFSLTRSELAQNQLTLSIPRPPHRAPRRNK